MPDKACQKAFDGAYALQRQVRDLVPDAVRGAIHLRTEECAEVDVLQDEFAARDIPIETGALWFEEPRAAARLISRKCEETGKECERDEDEKEICHDNQRTERRAKRLISMRSPNFCVASFKRSRTVLLASLTNGCSRSTWSRK